MKIRSAEPVPPSSSRSERCFVTLRSAKQLLQELALGPGEMGFFNLFFLSAIELSKYDLA